MPPVTNETAFDPREFRDLFGRFATGVTVVTINDGGDGHAMTANAVSSLSLDPMLLLVCVERSNSAHPFFERAESFAVNILAADQRELSDRFARHGDEQRTMDGVAHHIGVAGSPIIEGTLGYAECRVVDRHPGGDHTIVVGEVVDLAAGTAEEAPLVFFRGQYRELAGPA